MIKCLMSSFLAVLVSCIAFSQQDQVTFLPGLGKVQKTEYAGYVSSRSQSCSKENCVKPAGIFYWYVQADHSVNDTPLILWTSGGPGSSSLYGFFLENGPYQISHNGTLQQRRYAWTHFANYLMLDQPLGVGLSFANKSQLAQSPKIGGQQYLNALLHFFEKYPKLRHHPFYVSGESYAGTYEAVLVKDIIEYNKNHVKHRIPLKGVILISGWVDPILQQSTDATFAYTHGLITAKEKLSIDALYTHCQTLASQNNNRGVAVVKACSKVGDTISKITKLDLHDISGHPTVDDHALIAYLNRVSVRNAIHAKLGRTYADWSELPGYSQKNLELSFRKDYQDMLNAGVKLLVISGLEDASDCNFLGTDQWLLQLQWHGRQRFWQNRAVNWLDPKSHKLLGFEQVSLQLRWVKVLNSGHMVPVDQPKIANIIKRFVS